MQIHIPCNFLGIPKIQIEYPFSKWFFHNSYLPQYTMHFGLEQMQVDTTAY